MIGRALTLLVLLAPPLALAKDSLDDRRETFGAVVAPPSLPSGGIAAYGFAGVPEIGAGYRLGFGLVELEGRAIFDYFKVWPIGELRVRSTVWTHGPWEVAPFLGAGLGYDTGA